MQLGQFELAVAIPRDGRSQRIREYGHNGLTYIEGRRGQPFTILLKNNSPARVLAVVSIDGIGIIDGQPATAESRGYILNGYSSTEIKGWRTSLDEVRQFVFEDKASSYAAGTVNDSNCGVIACKVIGEKAKPVPLFQVPPRRIERVYVPVPYPVYPGPQPLWCYETHEYTGSIVPRGTSGMTSDTAVYACCVQKGALAAEPAAHADFKLGTGWGMPQSDPVNEVAFERGHEQTTMALYYTDAASLQRVGVVLSKDIAVSELPQGFNGFCRPPVAAR